MSSVAVSLIVFLCIFGGALLGMLLRRCVPEQHLSSESKDVVKLGTGLIGTMSALVLGLMVASAKSSYDAQKNELTEMSAGITWLDRILAQYGPEANHARELLRETVTDLVDQIWSEERSQMPQSAPAHAHGAALYDALHQLAPTSEEQRSIKAEALTISMNVGRMRSLLSRQAGSSISMPFLFVVVFWLTIIFMSFGLFAPVNATVVVTLVVCALSVSGAMFLIMELDQPFGGLIQISKAPLLTALSHLSH